MARNADGLGRKPHKWRGRWRAYLTVGYLPNGDADRTYVYGRTQMECQEKLDALRRQVSHADADARSVTVNQYLDGWLEDLGPEVSERTLEIYRHELAHLRPHIGRQRLTQLKPNHIKKAMRGIVGTEVEFGRKGDGKQTAVLTARAANAARVVLHKALADAVLDGSLPFNPAAKEYVKPLRDPRPEIIVWTAEEIEAFLTLTAAEACSLHPFFYIALTTGLRVGELGALEWRDIHDASLHVNRTLGSDGVKTPAARRIVPLPTDARQILEQYRETLRGEGVKSATVFATSNGNPVTRQHARKTLMRWARNASVTLLSPHGLRHTFASMMIAAGVDAATLSRILGHKSPAFTMDRYVHFFERAQPRTALTLGELTGSSNRAGVFLGGTPALGGLNPPRSQKENPVRDEVSSGGRHRIRTYDPSRVN